MEQQIRTNKESEGSSQGGNMKHKYTYNLSFLNFSWEKYFLYSLHLFHKCFYKVQFHLVHFYIVKNKADNYHVPIISNDLTTTKL